MFEIGDIIVSNYDGLFKYKILGKEKKGQQTLVEIQNINSQTTMYCNENSLEVLCRKENENDKT